MGLCDRVELSFLVLSTWIFFVLVVVGRVVDMTFTNAVFVALGHQLDEFLL